MDVISCNGFLIQDAIDLILGNYTVEENEGISRPSPLQAERDWKFYAVSCSFMRKYLSILFVFILILHSKCGQYFLLQNCDHAVNISRIIKIYMY